MLQFVVTVVFTCSASAQIATERILLPIMIHEELRGAHGSVWISELVITNRSETPVRLFGVLSDCRLGAGCIDAIVSPRSTFFPIVFGERDFPTKFLFIEPGRGEDLVFELRLLDLSRDTLTWGTAIPVIPVADALEGRADILNIPVDTEFRSRLRIYDFDPAPSRSVRVRAYAIPLTNILPELSSADALIFDMELELIVPRRANVPGYAELDLSSIHFPAGVARYRLEIEPLTPGLDYWAFVSVTNNETQHVTILAVQ